MNISYVIISNNNNFVKTDLTINSILYQYKNLDFDYEIIVCGLLEKQLIDKVNYFLIDQFSADKGYVGKLRNLGASKSKYENVVFLDDDIILDTNWLKNTINVENQWNVLGNKIFNIDGSRFWDRARFKPKHQLVDYKTMPSPKLYQTSGFMLVKKQVLNAVKWSETHKIHSDTPEDIVFSQSLHDNKIPIDFNENALVWHNSDQYTQSGDIVIKQKTEPCKDFLDNIEIIDNSI
jgi:hypothetical protein